MLCACLSTAGAVFAAPVGTVRLHERADVSPGEVQLSQIASVSASDQAQAKALGQLVVARVGAARTEVRLSQTEIARILARQGATLEWRWHGAHEVALRVVAHEVAAAQIVERAEAALRQALQGCCELQALQVLSRPATLRLAPGEVTLTARVRDAAPQRRMVAEVHVLLDGKLQRSVPVSFEVRATAQAWVAAREMRAGQVIAEADVRREAAELPALHGATLPPAVIGQRLVRDASAGQAIASTLVQRVALVSRQDEVSVEMRSGAVQLTSRGVALSDGELGQRVRVQVGDQKLTARVAGAGQVVLGQER
jgi:flagella basal body P-ring formation protein FlgA